MINKQQINGKLNEINLVFILNITLINFEKTLYLQKSYPINRVNPPMYFSLLAEKPHTTECEDL